VLTRFRSHVNHLTHLELTSVGKTFDNFRVFSDVSFKLSCGQSLAICGRNGSGKSTLLKIVANLFTASKGSLEFFEGESKIDKVVLFRHLGYVAPYLKLYDEFSAIENMEFVCSMRGLKGKSAEIEALISRVGLAIRMHAPAGKYSSGMNQRLKFACSLIHSPSMLLLDEPTANLDGEGKEIVKAIIDEYRSKSVIIVATNEPNEMAWCDSVLDLNSYRGA
jgi:heme exporter protein A